jgi:hypothetical protein
LKINNVHVTARAVYKYFKCHPDGYRFSTRGPTNRDQRASAALTSTHTDGKPATSTAASVSAQHPPGAKASSPPLHAREVGLTDAHLDGSTNGSENTRAFDPSGTPDSNYDRGTREGPRLVSVEDEPRVRSKMIHWDPFSPENREAVLAYVEGLKAGTIPTGVITNSERQSNERQEDPDHP